MSALPASVQPLLDGYLTALRQQLPGFATGIFIHGSIALDAFNPRSSDVDMVTVISRRATQDDIARLTEIHRLLNERFPKPLLEVTYLQSSDLGKLGDAIAPHPTVHDGALQPSAHFDENSITWWLLKNRGIAMLGTLPDFEVDWAKLVADTHQNMNSYWARFTREPQRVAWLYSDFGVQWAVLGVLRQYYTFEAGGITSKDGAGYYALKSLPPHWHRLIEEALGIRQETSTSAYRFRLLRAFEAWRFLRWLIRSCNQLFTINAAGY